MKVIAAFAALAALASALPEKLDKRTVDPASATASLIAVLPSSILNVALTNQAAATSLIEQAFSTGTPAWFTSLPGEVQTYFLTQVGAGPATATASVTSSASVPLGTGSSSGNSTAMTSGRYSNSTTTSTGTSTSTRTTGSSSSSRASAATSSSSTGGAAVPTAIIGGGLAGVVGLLGMLAL